MDFGDDAAEAEYRQRLREWLQQVLPVLGSLNQKRASLYKTSAGASATAAMTGTAGTTAVAATVAAPLRTTSLRVSALDMVRFYRGPESRATTHQGLRRSFGLRA